ncbi:glutathionylspermidine synthase family protein [Microbacteriaceae bacterium 4G12]
MKDKPRIDFYQTIPQFWADLYEEPYALYDATCITRKQKEKLQEATRCVGQIFFKVADLLRRLDDETLLAMSYPKEALLFLKLTSSLPESVIARLDFIPCGDSFKVIELNADTPTFIKELFSVNKQVCDHFGIQDVNAGEEAKLQQAIRFAIERARQDSKKEDPYVVFTSHEHIEDQFTTMYLQQLYGKPSRFVLLKNLQIVEHDGLYDEHGKKIDILYRQTFPIECLLLDHDEAGAPIGEMLLSLVEERRLQLINPPSAFLLQNKAVQAVIWGLYEEQNPFFTEEEHMWIAEYFLPTYLEEDLFLDNGISYVKKPVFGREGDTVEIYNENGEKELEDTYRSYEQYGFVYQKYIALPIIEANVNGKREMVHQMYGSFLINGVESSIGCRVGGKITNNLSYYLPVGIKKDEV